MDVSRRMKSVLALLLVIASSAGAQTPVDVHRNKYTPAQDVELGRQAAAEVEKELPLLRDEQVAEMVNRIGERLVAAIPPDRQVPEFRYSFTVTNLKDINAFALPGGPMYINRGMLEAAKTEAEAAGVMAHELSHVVLRHGTAQATAATKFQIGQVAGQILGAIVGGQKGAIIAQGSEFGLGTYFLKYSREFERESDLLGAQILARAAYDPREMANMFKTLQAQGGARAPEWMSTHPDPGNRYEAINREAALLQVENPVRSSQEFAALQTRLRSISPAQSAQSTTTGTRRPSPTSGSGSGGGGVANVEPPSGQYREVQADLVRLAIPANWQEDSTDGHLTFAPPGAVYQGNGASAFTHGVQIGAVRTQAQELQQATSEVVQLFARSNPNARSQGSRRETLSGRESLITQLTNVSAATGRPEVVTLSTMQLRDGSLLYLLAVVPQNEVGKYEPAFRRVRQSLQVLDDALSRK